MDALVGVLGTTALLLDNGPDATWGGPRERAVLATLVVHAGEVVPVETLLRWVWPRDKPIPLNPEPTLDTYASRIRRVLERLPDPPRLRVGSGGYRLELGRMRTDLDQFRNLVAEARTYVEGDPARTVRVLDDAFWLWRGLPLADLTSEPAREWRERVLRDEWLAAHMIRVQALLDLGRFDELIAALNELQVDYPDNLQLANLRLAGLYGRRRYADATRYYLATRRRLRADGEEQAAFRFRRYRGALAAEHDAEHAEPTGPAPTTVPRQLPRDVDDFVGRRLQLCMLDEAGGPTGLLILDGLGGVGKTALAVHWAHHVRARFPDGELFADLRGTAGRAAVDAAVVIDDFLVALGQRPEPVLSRRQRAQLLSRLLADRRTLVVLDNVRDSAQVSDLMKVLSSCLVIVTSRRRLSELRAATGGRRISVPPMNAAESAALLSVRAHGRIPPPHRLIDLCGGLPLMITVLAARLNRRKLLTTVGEHGTGPAGDTCLLSSYRSLAEPERRLFRLLALHHGQGISVEAACACDDRNPTATLRSLGALAEARLLEPPDEFDRFRCHGQLAEFATRRLELDESPGTRRAALVRLLDFHIASATQAARTLMPRYVASSNQPDAYTPSFEDEGEAWDWLGRERTALVAAVRQAHAHGCHEQVWRLADPVAACFDEAGLHVESKEVRALAVEAAKVTGERRRAATLLADLGATHLALADHEAARRCLETALPLAEAGGQDNLVVSVLRSLGQIAVLRGETAEALECYRGAMTVAERTGDREDLCWTLFRTGQALRVAERYADAVGHLDRALVLALQLRDSTAQVACLVEVGGAHRDLGAHTMALARCDEALAVAEGGSDLTSAALICVTLAQICSEQRQFAKAVSYGRRGAAIMQSTQNLAAHARVVEALADALHDSGEPHEAAATWRQAAELYGHTGVPELAALLMEKIEQVRLPGSVPPARTGSPEPVEPPLLEVVNGYPDPPARFPE